MSNADLDVRIARDGWTRSNYGRTYRRGDEYLTIEELRDRYSGWDGSSMVPCSVSPANHGFHRADEACGMCPRVATDDEDEIDYEAAWRRMTGMLYTAVVGGAVFDESVERPYGNVRVYASPRGFSSCGGNFYYISFWHPGVDTTAGRPVTEHDFESGLQWLDAQCHLQVEERK